MKTTPLSLIVLGALLVAPMTGCNKSGSSSITPEKTASTPAPPPDDTILANPVVGPGPAVNPGNTGGGNTGGGSTGGGSTGGGGTGGGSTGGGSNPPPEQPAVPEPGTIAVVGLGLAAAHLASRRKRRK